MITIIYESIIYTIEDTLETDNLKELLYKYSTCADFDTFKMIEDLKLQCVYAYRNEILEYTKRLADKNPHLCIECYRPTTYPFIRGEKTIKIGCL